MGAVSKNNVPVVAFVEPRIFSAAIMEIMEINENDERDNKNNEYDGDFNKATTAEHLLFGMK
eukprot:3121987-Ditylum_brightwellii.AAC.1